MRLCCGGGGAGRYMRGNCGVDRKLCVVGGKLAWGIHAVMAWRAGRAW